MASTSPTQNKDPESQASASQSTETMPSSSAQLSTSSEPTPDTPRRFVTSGILTLYFGKKRKEFEIHKSLLMARSKYFEVMLAENAEWKEGQTNEVYWDDEDDGITTDAMEVWTDWLYGRRIDGVTVALLTLFASYKLGEKRLMYDFKNAIMDAFRERHVTKNQYCSASDLTLITKLGLQGTPLHTCIIRCIVSNIHRKPALWEGPTEQSARNSKELREAMKDAEMAWRIMEGLIKCKIEPHNSPHPLKGCHFHDHSDGSVCDAKGVSK